MKIFPLCLLLITAYSGLAAAADTYFISDICYVSLRADQTNESKVVHSGLKSGTAVTLLEAPAGSEWSKVKTDTGTEGWIRRLFITNTPTAQMQLEKLQANPVKPPALEPGAEVPPACLSYAAELSNLKALSIDAVNLDKRYQDLLTEHEMAKTNLDGLRAENERLKDSTRYTQWIYGGSLVVIGILLTLFIQAVRPKRRSEWA